MFRKKPDYFTQMKHHNIAAKFVTKVICQTCVETEGLCRCRGNENEAYKKCNYFHDAVNATKRYWINITYRETH
jgi:hypothetical protein